jgi:hypothetical protein
MKRLLALGALTAAAVALPASLAIADAPPDRVWRRSPSNAPRARSRSSARPATRRAGGVDDQHMVLLSITLSADGVTIFTKTYGQKRGLATNAVSCTVTDPFGTATVVRAPVPPKG